MFANGLNGQGSWVFGLDEGYYSKAIDGGYYCGSYGADEGSGIDC